MGGRRLAVNQRCRLKYAHFVFVGSGYFARIGATIERRYSNVVVCGAGYDLHTFECTCQNDNITSCSVCLSRTQTHTEENINVINGEPTKYISIRICDKWMKWSHRWWAWHDRKCCRQSESAYTFQPDSAILQISQRRNMQLFIVSDERPAICKWYKRLANCPPDSIFVKSCGNFFDIRLISRDDTESCDRTKRR